MDVHYYKPCRKGGHTHNQLANLTDDERTTDINGHVFKAEIAPIQ